MDREAKIANRIVASYDILQDGVFAALNSKLRGWKPKVTVDITGHVDAETNKIVWKVMDIKKSDDSRTVLYIYIKRFIIDMFKGERGVEIIETSEFIDFMNEELDDFENMAIMVVVKIYNDMSVIRKENKELPWKDFQEVIELPILIRQSSDRVTFEIDNDRRVEERISEHLERMRK
jgi:hypothetical protein